MTQRGDETGSAGRGLVAIAGAKVYFIVASYGVQLALPRLFGTPEQFGLFSHVMSAVSIVNNVLIAATIQSVSKFVSEDEGRGPAVLRQGLRLQLVLGGALSAFLFSFAPYLSEHIFQIPQGADLFRVSSAVVLAYAVYAALVGSLNGRRLFLKQATLDMSFTTLRSAGIVVGAVLGLGALGSISGFALAAVGILLLALFVVGLGSPGKGLGLRTWAVFMGPIWLYQSLLNFVLQIDIQVLARTLTRMAHDAGIADAAGHSLRFVGYYRGAQTFAFVPYQLILSMTFIVFPLISRATSAGDTEAARDTIRRAIRLSLLFLLAIAAPIAGSADGVLRIAYPADYLAGSQALAVLVFGIAAFALFVIAATVLSSSGSPGLAAAIAGVSLAVVMAATRLLIQREGITGDPLFAAALGTSLGTAVSLLLAGAAVYYRFQAFVAPLTVARGLLAAAAAFVAAGAMPHATRLTAIVALAAGFLVYVATLALLRELGPADFAAIRRVLKR